MELFQNKRKLMLAITLFVYLDYVTAQPGSILWAYVRRFAPNFVINNTAVYEITTQAVNSSIIPDIRRARIKKITQGTNKIPQSTKGEVMAQETIKYFVKSPKNIRELTKKIKGDLITPYYAKKTTMKAKQNVSVSTEVDDDQDTEKSSKKIEKEYTKRTPISEILKNRPILRAKQHQKESGDAVYEKQVTEADHNSIEPAENALDSDAQDKTVILRSKKHKKTTVETEDSASTEVENEHDMGQNETNVEKDGLRSGTEMDDNDMAEGKVTKKLRFRAKHKVTQMQPELMMKADENRNVGPTHNEHLNPYAINRQMQRFIEDNNGLMNIKMEIIGRTVEYNDIILMKITGNEDKVFRSHKYAKEVPEKKIIFIVHGLSILGMGELIKDETMFKTLMDSYTQHLDHFDIFIIPMANPDGFAAILNSQEGKFWNKNMSPQSNCAGVALDRNFDVEWNSSSDISSCSHIYPGPIPFSEAETRAIREVFHLYGHKIVAYIHLHASTYSSKIFKGDAILHPKGYSTDHNDDDKYIEIKADIEDALKNASFKVLSVTVEPLFKWYGIVTGSSVDFASTVYGIPYAMEFCMQSYTHLEHDALYQIWKRIIDSAFQCIWRNISNKNVKKK